MTGRRRVLVVGLGTIAGTHLEVLAADPGYEVVGGVDPHPRRQHVDPLFSDLDAAFAAGLDPDLVVVATPTPTHVDLVADLLVRSDATILSEKPLATSVAEIDRLEQAHGRDRVRGRVRVAHHFAFSPEVEWARRVVRDHPEWGAPSSVLSVFNDAYAPLPAEQRAGYVSTWVDSGPNQLSTVAAFATGWRVVAHDDAGDRAVTTLEHDGGRTVLSSNWRAADTSKQTTLRFDEASVEVRIDHTSMTAVVLRSGEVVEHVGYAGTAGRKVAHYQGLYRVLREDPADHRLGVGLAAEIATLLEAAPATPSGGVRWSAIDVTG